MNYLKLSGLITTLCLLTQGNLYGQSDSTSDSSLQRLDRVIVSATKSSRKISESAASVVVITRKEIQASAAKNIDDVLQYASGVQVKRPVGMGEGVPSDIVLRGIPGALAAARVLILVDGIPTNVAGTPFLIVNEIPLDAIQRIEIVKGPFSSLYGANALGGVINVITVQGSGKPMFTLSGETSYPFNAIANFIDKDDTLSKSEKMKETNREAYWNATVQSSGMIGKCSYLLSGGARTIGNYYNSDSTFVRNVTSTGKDTTYHQKGDNHGYTDYRLFFKGGYTFNDAVALTLHARYFNSTLGFGLTSDSDSTERVTAGSKFLVGPFLQITLAPWIGVYTGGFFRNVTGTYYDQFPATINNVTDTIPSYFDVSSDDFQFEGRTELSVGKSNKLAIGFDQLWNKINYSAISGRESRLPIPGCYAVRKDLINAGVYLQNEYTLLSNVHFIAALRYDNHSAFGSNWSPKLSVTGNVVDKIVLRASAGKAFRAPSVTELYMPDMYFGRVYLKSNAALQPENVVSYDGGFQCLLPAGFLLSSDLFYNDLSNLVVLGNLDFSTMRVSHANVSDAYSWGVENELAWEKYKWIGAKLNYAYTNSKNKVYNQGLDYIPKHKANLMIDINRKVSKCILGGSADQGYVGIRSAPDWGHPKILLTSTSDEIIPRYITLPSYWRTDLSIYCTFANRYTISLSAQNLFNALVEESLGTLTSARFASIKLKAVF